MADPNRSGPGPTQRDSTPKLVTTGAVVAALYFGNEIFVPIALAILLAFVLAPGVRVLRSAHLGRILPVGLMSGLAFLIIFGLGGLMAAQLRDLAMGLPQYQATISTKVEALRGMTSGGALKRFGELFSTLSHDIAKPQANPQAPQAAPGPREAEPLPVTIRQPDPTPMETLSSILLRLLHPLTTGGVVAIFVIFILLQREDLRNRLIRVLGEGDIHRSTTAIDDAARRLSRYLLAQLAVNTASGLLVAGALSIIGVPSPMLWGIFFGCLRFVPYVGPPLGAIPPILLAAAVSPGWSVALWTAAVFVAIEIVIGQIVEPFLYGHHTGLSPVAVVVAATFWTALWGPIGLILSTPMTVCLVVLGRHVEHLSFLDLLLGDRPPLSPREMFYQRLLANDPVDAADQARQALRQTSLVDYCDDVVLPALLLAQDDADQGRLDGERQQRIAQASAAVIEDLADIDTDAVATRSRDGAAAEKPADSMAPQSDPAEPDADIPDTVSEPPPDPRWREPGAVLCVGARGPLDDAAAMLLAQLLERHELGARSASFETLLEANIDKADLASARLVVLSCLHGSTAYLRFVLRRLHRKAPQAKVLVGAWWRSVEGRGPAPDEAMGDAQATTLAEAVSVLIGHAAAERSSAPADRDGSDPEPAGAGVAPRLATS